MNIYIYIYIYIYNIHNTMAVACTLDSHNLWMYTHIQLAIIYYMHCCIAYFIYIGIYF